MFIGRTTYDAKIVTASGMFTDNGVSPVTFYPSFLGGFEESFRSSLNSPTPIRPTSKDQCKNGGWKQFGFKNQGRCIAFVNHHE